MMPPHQYVRTIYLFLFFSTAFPSNLSKKKVIPSKKIIFLVIIWFFHFLQIENWSVLMVNNSWIIVFLDKLQGKAVGKKQEKISYTYVLMGRHHLCYRWLDWGNRDLGNERTGWILEIEIRGCRKKKEREEIINGKERRI